MAPSETIQQLCQKHCLRFGAIVECLYHNNLRNAFVHSDFLIDGPYILFSDPVHGKRKQPDVDLQTWYQLFDLTMEFAKDVFRCRHIAETTLDRIRPLKIDLEEFPDRFFVNRDDRGVWFAESLDLPS